MCLLFDIFMCYGIPYLAIGLVFFIYERLTKKPADRRHARALLLTGALVSAPFFVVVAVLIVREMCGR